MSNTAVLIPVCLLLSLLTTGCQTETYQETSTSVSEVLSKTGEAVKEAGKATSEAITVACKSVKKSMDADSKKC